MSLLDDAKALVAKIEADFKPEIKTVENDAKAIGASTLSYIETNGLQDLYQIALVVVGAMAPGASWTAALAAIVAQATTDGKTILAGSESIVAAQAQADLLAAGKSAGLPVAAA